jgi:hypothetical protein
MFDIANPPAPDCRVLLTYRNGVIGDVRTAEESEMLTSSAGFSNYLHKRGYSLVSNEQITDILRVIEALSHGNSLPQHTTEFLKGHLKALLNDKGASHGA